MSGYISSPSRTAAILKENNIRLSRSYGQNFLIDTNMLKKMIRHARLKKDDRILEVGCGIGNLTELLAAQADKILCLEVDKKLAEIFNRLFSDHIGSRIILVCGDAMKMDYGLMEREYGLNKFVSNLPYKIAAPLILKVFCQTEGIKEAYLTIQKDIAERVTAVSGDKNYSSYTVKANYLADFTNCFDISRNCFIPRPNVDSSFIKGIKKHPVLSDTRKFFDFVDACFAHRRKKLVNSLQKYEAYREKLDEIKKLLEKMGRSSNIRPEELSVEDYIYLYGQLF